MSVLRHGSRRWSGHQLAGIDRCPRSLLLEPLEDRRMLSGDAVELLPDRFTLSGESSWVELDVVANDIFPDDYAGARRISSASYGSLGGVVRLAGEGTLLEYQSPAGVYGDDALVYIVDEQYVGQVTVTIEPPLADDSFDVVQHSAEVRLDVLANDTYLPDDAGERVITAVSAASMASSVRIADGGKAVYYAPAADAQGVERFRYLVDGQFEAVVSVHVHRPVRDDVVSVEQNSASNRLDVLHNDSYIDSHNVWHDVVDRVTSVGETQHGGTVSLADDGSSLIYSPPDDFVGTDRFAYRADGIHQASVYVTVTRPVRPDWLTVHQQSSQQVLDVMANDFWTGAYTGDRQITSVTETEHGTVDIAPDGRWLIYTPADLFAGTDHFEYTVDDALTTSVTVNVLPLAQADSYRFGVSPYVTHYRLDLLQNDLFDPSATGAVRITSVTDPPEGGTVEILAGAQSVRFTPAAATAGGASFSYVVDDLFEARVSVSLVGYLTGDSVVVKQNSRDNSFDVLRNDFVQRYQLPPYDGPRRITSVGTPDHGGSVVIEADGRTVQYTPPVDFLGIDRFSYVVDGVQSATVDVRVIGYARDDRFRVDPDSGDHQLRVLVNDRIDPASGDARRVASVTETAAGGVATVSDDGQTVHYTPPAGFVGTDQFAYWLDNASRAEVTVEVTADLDRLLPRFDHQAELEEYLIHDAVERYAPQFGQPAWGGPMVDWDYLQLSRASDGVAAPESVRDHSETNVQVADVDEGDIIELDADFVYIVTQDSLVIADAWPAEQLHVASRTALPGRPLVEYLRDDRLTMISDTSVWVVDDEGHEAPGGEEPGGEPLGDEPMPTGVVDGFGIFPPLGRWVPSVTVIVFDISDRTAPAVVQETRFDGGYVDSRSVNGFVYLVLQQPFMLPPPLPVCSEEPGDEDTSGSGGDTTGLDGVLTPPNGGNCVYQTEEQYLTWVRANIGELITEVLPEFTSYAADHQFVRGGLLAEAADIFRPGDTDVGHLLVVTGIDMTSSLPGPVSSVAIPTSPAAQIYASRDNLYIFQGRAASLLFGNLVGAGEATMGILKFSWNSSDGQLDFVATGEVPGSLHNQFSVDEHAGLLRVATTSSHYSPGEAWARSSNELFVLTDSGGILEGLASLQGLAPQETIRSVRFLGDRAYVVTFRNIDPLIALDLSDPTSPRVTGELKIPGFSSYLQFVGDHYLVGLGRNTPDGWNGPPQLTLFDLHDSGPPVVIDQFTWEHWSRTEAATDHHAFGYFAAHDMLAIPVGNLRREWLDEDGDGFHDRSVYHRQDDLYVFQLGVAPSGPVDPGIELLGTVAHDWQVRRSGYIADRLYSVSTDDVIVSDVTDLSVPIATLVFGATIDGGDTPPPPLPIQTPTPIDDDPLRDAVRTASASMADQLGIEPGRIALVIAEADRYPNACDTVAADGNCVSESDPGYALVLQADGTRYLYQTHQPGDVQLVDAEFDFTATVTARHNAHNPLDTDDDGEVSPLDALLVINVLNEMAAKTSRTAPLRAVDPLIHQSRSAYYTDVNGDGSVAPIDALWVINHLNATAPLAAAGGASDTGVALPAVATAPAAELEVDRSATMATRIASGPQAAESSSSVAPQRRAALLSDAGLRERPRPPIERSSHSQRALPLELHQRVNSDLPDTVRGGLHDRFFSDLGRWRG